MTIDFNAVATDPVHLAAELEILKNDVADLDVGLPIAESGTSHSGAPVFQDLEKARLVNLASSRKTVTVSLCVSEPVYLRSCLAMGELEDCASEMPTPKPETASQRRT